MKWGKTFITNILVCMYAVLLSCNNNGEEITGYTTPINLEVTEISVDAKESENTVNILGNTEWWLTGVSIVIDTDTTHIANEGEIINEGTIRERRKAKETIVGEWYTIKRLDEGKVIYVNVLENQTNKERELYIGLTVGNSGSSLLIKQEWE